MIDDDFIDLVVADSQALPSFAWRGLADALPGRRTFPPPIAGSRRRPALIWGDCDSFVPRSEQDAMLSAIRHATLHALDDTGHAVHWDRPGETAAIINALVKNVAARLAA